MLSRLRSGSTSLSISSLSKVPSPFRIKQVKAKGSFIVHCLLETGTIPAEPTTAPPWTRGGQRDRDENPGTNEFLYRMQCPSATVPTQNRLCHQSLVNQLIPPHDYKPMSNSALPTTSQTAIRTPPPVNAFLLLGSLPGQFSWLLQHQEQHQEEEERGW
jgi:hypothetical protein